MRVRAAVAHAAFFLFFMAAIKFKNPLRVPLIVPMIITYGSLLLPLYATPDLTSSA